MKPTTCFAPAHILLPSEQVPLEQWGCIACDQFTSDRSYWQRAEETAAGAPSTLNLILPEVYLEDGDADARVEKNPRHHAGLCPERAHPGGGRLYLCRAHRAERPGAAGSCRACGLGSLQLPPGRKNAPCAPASAPWKAASRPA